jgi:outer membrane protein OmpA-like peptidoglycan-associated protein
LNQEQGGFMKNENFSHLTQVLLIALVLSITSIGLAQDSAGTGQGQSQVNAVQVQTGERVKVEGTILQKKSGGLTLLCPGGIIYDISISSTTEIKERKKNPFRGAKGYSEADLLQGLQVEVQGTGDSKGNLVAREIKLKNSDLEIAQTMDTRVVPVENELKATQVRLGETEQNAQRLSGQVQELAEVSNSARAGAVKAQESADRALSAANNAKERVVITNERITALDDYQVKSTVTVQFLVGSAVLSEEAKSNLRALAGQVGNEKGYLIEVAGFASSDGDVDFNRRLSQKRADAVIQHMAELYNIPLRRFVTPMGYGENQPVADNQTLLGRSQNRRVEVRVLVSKGLIHPDPATTETEPVNR